MPNVILAPEIFGPDRDPPTTPMEALMRSGPNEPEESTMERKHPLEAAIAEAMSDFTELEQDMLVMLLVGQMSYRRIAESVGLSKSEVHRRLPKLQERLAKAFKSNPEILKYVGG